MKNYNYDNLNGDEHIVSNWEPLDFKVKDNYKFIPNNIFYKFFHILITTLIQIPLIIINKLFYGFKVENKKNLKGYKKGMINVSNHVHSMDCTMVAITLFPRICFYPTVISNFNIPFIRSLIRILGAIPIPKEDKKKQEFFTDINSVLVNGKVVQMYPESALWPYYEGIRNFKDGAFVMAVRANVPIQPMRFIFVKQTGIFKLYKKEKCIHLVILEKIYPNEKLPHKERIQDLKERVYKEMIRS